MTTETTTASSRRTFLGRIGVAAAGGAGLAFGASLLEGASAGALTGAMQYGDVNDAGASETSLTASHGTATLTIDNTGDGRALDIVGSSNVVNRATLTTSNTGTNSAVFAVQANVASSVAAINAVVWGDGPAVAANTLSDAGGGFESVTNDAPGLLARVYGQGRAVFGRVYTQASNASAVYGDTSGTGAGVEGRGRNGRGGKFSGTKAQINLVPGTAASHPASGSTGDLYVDANQRLWFCRGGVSWVQVA